MAHDHDNDSTLQKPERRNLLREGLLRLRGLFLPSSGLHIGDNRLEVKKDATGVQNLYLRRLDGTEDKMSGDAPAARVFNSANISIPNDTLTTLTYNSERHDNDAIHSTSVSTGRLTAKTAGLYAIGACNSIAANATGRRQMQLREGGDTIIAVQEWDTNQSSANTIMTLSTQYDLAKDEYVECLVYQNSGGALNVETVANYSPEFWMVRLGASGTGVAVTMSGTPDYITLSGQDIVRGLIDLTADVSGALPITSGGTEQTSRQAAIDTLTNVAAATDEHVLTKDGTSGNAIFKASGGGGGGAPSPHDETHHTGDIIPDADQTFAGALTITGATGEQFILKNVFGVKYMATTGLGGTGIWRFFEGGILEFRSGSDTASRKAVLLGSSGAMRLGDSVLPVEILEVAGNALVTGTLKPQTGILLDEQSTPSNPAENTAHLFTRANGSSIDLVFRTSTGAECVICSELDTTATPPGATMLMMGVQTA